MSEAEQTERKEIGRIKLSDNQDLIASVVDDKKFKLSIADKTDNKKLELSIVDKNMKDKNKEGFLFSWLVSFFRGLRKTTVCELVRACCSKEGDRGYSDYWVLGNFLLSIALWLIMPNVVCVEWLIWLIVVCSIWRIYESVVTVTQVALFGSATQKILNPKRNVVYALMTYAGLSFWFAILYMKFGDLFKSKHIELSSSLGSWYFSVVTMSTLGYGDIYPNVSWGGLIVILQTMIGIFFAIIIIGSFISWVKPPETNSK